MRTSFYACDIDATIITHYGGRYRYLKRLGNASHSQLESAYCLLQASHSTHQRALVLFIHKSTP